VGFLDFCEEWMGESLFYGDSEVWVELEHLVEEVDSFCGGSGVFLR